MKEKVQINGNVKISDDVIATIANIAVSEVDGVAKKYTKPDAKSILGKKNIAKGVRVTRISDEVIGLEIDIVVLYGAKLVEVAWNVQDNVKNHVESMTGLSVEKVNVHIVNVEIEKTEPAKNVSDDEDNSSAPDKIE